MKQISEITSQSGAGISRANTETTSSTESDTAGVSVCPICGGLGYLRVDVPVDDPDFGKLVACRCRLAELADHRATVLRSESELGVLSRMTFGTFMPEGLGLSPEKQANLRWAYEESCRFVQNPQGWLIFRGGYGCGKTHLAAAIANSCIERGIPAMFTTVPDLLDHLRATFAPSSTMLYDEKFEEVRTAPVLILDDLGTESSTAWAQEKLFQIVNYRYNAQLPTVITTNHELEDIPLRLRSRLVDPGLACVVSITAPDYRRSGIAQDASELSALSLHSQQTFDTFDLRRGEITEEEYSNLKRAEEISRTFAQDPRDWLILTGSYGCGKTHLAAAIANVCTNAGHTALFVLVPDLLDHLRASFSPQSSTSFDRRFEEVRRSPFLILDDLGIESATPWAKEKLYQIFDYRYNARLPTVITTALAIEEIDPRLATRMLDVSRCTLFAILAPAYRGGAIPAKNGRRRKR